MPYWTRPWTCVPGYQPEVLLAASQEKRASSDAGFVHFPILSSIVSTFDASCHV